MELLKRRIENRLDEIVELRRNLHQYPELAYSENRTAETIMEKLENLNDLHLQKGLAGTGIVATLGGDLSGPRLALRADMDALPIREEGEKAYNYKIQRIVDQQRCRTFRVDYVFGFSRKNSKGHIMEIEMINQFVNQLAMCELLSAHSLLEPS